jgi:two-component system, chemotaxis family, chemotaxis protein CheY
MSRSILVVDDNEDIREAMALVLRDAGYQVMAAPGGSEAFNLLHDGYRPSVILLDLMMPGMSGWDLHRAISDDRTLHAIPVIIVSAVAAEAAGSLNPVAHLQKPFTIDDLLGAVERVCTT